MLTFHELSHSNPPGTLKLFVCRDSGILKMPGGCSRKYAKKGCQGTGELGGDARRAPLPAGGVQEGPGRRQGGQKAEGRPNTPTSLVVAALRSLQSPIHRGFPHQASRQTRFDICLMHPSSSKASVCCQGPHRFCMLGRTLDRLL